VTIKARETNGQERPIMQPIKTTT